MRNFEIDIIRKQEREFWTSFFEKKIEFTSEDFVKIIRDKNELLDIQNASIEIQHDQILTMDREFYFCMFLIMLLGFYSIVGTILVASRNLL